MDRCRINFQSAGIHVIPTFETVTILFFFDSPERGFYQHQAGTGTASADGWRWTPQNELAADVATAVAVYRNEQLARLVQLPVSIL